MGILVFLLAQLLVYAMAADFAFNNASFTGIRFASCIVVEDWVYILGGEFISQNGTTLKNHQIIAVDLSQSWTADLVVGISSQTNDINAFSGGPKLWYNDITKEIGVYGGLVPYPSSREHHVSVSVFTPGIRGLVSDLKEKYVKGDGSSFNHITRTSYGLSTSSPTAFYNLGGRVSWLTDPDFGEDIIALSSLLIYDFVSATWRNETVDFRKVYGEAQFIPSFGDEGVLIFWGGDDLTTNEPFVTAATLVAGDAIRIYDIASRKWHQKKATGDIPMKRTSACSVAVGELGSGSYEIYYFGGGFWQFSNASVTEESYLELSTVYILSLPSFTWIKTSASSAWRRAHACAVVGRQMLTVGGRFNGPGRLTEFTERRDLLEIFDLVDLKWTNKYNRSAAPYTRPAIVQSLYEGGKPITTVSWESPALQAIFQSSINATTTSTGTATENSGAVTGNPGDTTSENRPSLAGPIAGGVVGGVIAVVSIVLLVLWLRRRSVRREQDAAAGTAATDDANVPSIIREMDGSRVHATGKSNYAIREVDAGNVPQEVRGGNAHVPPPVDDEKYPPRKPVPIEMV